MTSDSDALVFDSVSFVRKGELILDNINFKIGASERWALIGRNGAGKSTLVDMVYARKWPSKGAVSVLGQKYGSCIIQEVRKKLGILQPAHQSDLLQKGLTARKIVATGSENTLGIYQPIHGSILKKADDLVEEAGFAHLAGRRYLDLSTGEKRIILLLRIMMAEPRLLMLDEPVASLDLAETHRFHILLQNFVERQLPILLITHRVDEIPAGFTHALLMKSGRVTASGSIEKVITSDNLSSLYDLKVEAVKRGERYHASIEY